MGFGDITPKTDLARLVTTFQMLADLAVIAIVIRLILGAAKPNAAGRRRRRRHLLDPGEDAAPAG